MKFKTTRREIKDNYKHIINAGDGNLQYLLSFTAPVAYNAGVYGWNYDLYEINAPETGKIAIINGYRGFGNIKPAYETMCNYDDKAAEIIRNSRDNYETIKIYVNELLTAFLVEVLKK